MDLLLWGIAVRQHEPGIGMGQSGIRGIPKGLQPFLCQSIAACPPGILLTGKIQDDIVHLLPDLWISGEGLVPESGRIVERQFLPDGLEIQLWVCKRLGGTIRIAHPACQIRLGIEKARLLNGSGPQRNAGLISSFGFLLHRYHLAFL